MIRFLHSFSQSNSSVPFFHLALISRTLFYITVTDRAAYQASVWMTLESQRRIPPPDGFGWEVRNNRWQPVWTRLPEVSKACSELLKCGCKTGCTSNRWKCLRATSHKYRPISTFGGTSGKIDFAHILLIDRP